MATTTPPTTTPIGADIRQLLQRLRRRIRLYVWIEGLSLAVVWVALTFWLGLAIDYLPVLAGASEMPHTARMVLLSLIAAVLAMILYYWILRRTFVPLPDHSMALLLERHSGQFDDALVTTVEMSGQSSSRSSFSHDMLDHTTRDVRSHLDEVRLGGIFRVSTLLTKCLIALAAIGSILLLYATNTQAFAIWTNRLYLLSDQTWPRRTEISVAGIQIQRSSATDGSPQLSALIPFSDNREIKIAKGTSVVLKVAADAAKVIPEYCTVHYRTDEDERGQVNMQKFGRIKDNLQLFAFEDKPFRGILSSIEFDVRALDHRVQGYRLHVVPSPAIIDTQLECSFPDYMVNEELSLWLPRTLELVSGTQLPIGTRITIRARSNKDLTRVDLVKNQVDSTTLLKSDNSLTDPRAFEYVVPALEDSLTLEVRLSDTDGVISDPPHKIFIAGIPDQPPEVNVTLQGIGTAITPRAIIPARGKIDDDYDIGRCWFELLINDGEPKEFEFDLQQGRSVDAAIDFLALQTDSAPVTLKPQDKLTLRIMAADRYDLGDQPNVGIGDRYQLEVVTADQLLAMLERRELGLRRRFEQVIDELSEMRDSLSRVKSSAQAQQSRAPEDARPATDETADPSTNSDPEAASRAAQLLEREASLRLLRVQRAAMQSQKSAQEVLGIAESFDDIRQELVNNRIDSEDKKIRLRDQIIGPLRLVCETMFPVLDQQINQLEQTVSNPVTRDEAAEMAITTAEDILFELDKVLQKMVELETFNELVNIVRSLIESQQELIDDTKAERVKRARSLLE